MPKLVIEYGTQRRKLALPLAVGDSSASSTIWKFTKSVVLKKVSTFSLILFVIC